ncbi:MAG: hypothetical protein LBC78_03050 [Oscillospiraceae bacterium]|jgi:hypothetical protein|nr:hypothetical protein [Oscillospiraceae bacterium]
MEELVARQIADPGWESVSSDSAAPGSYRAEHESKTLPAAAGYQAPQILPDQTLPQTSPPPGSALPAGGSQGAAPSGLAKKPAYALPAALENANSPGSCSAVSPFTMELRPTLGPSKEALADAQELRDIMDQIAAAARQYCSLAKCSHGEAKKLFLCLQKSCRGTLRLLNAQHYILTGEIYCPASRVSPAANRCEALRKLCALEAQARAKCACLASTTSFPSVNLACACAARQCACRERAAECRLGKMIGA